jgi:predicted MPP superfamily phosphohydrolase
MSVSPPPNHQPKVLQAPQCDFCIVHPASGEALTAVGVQVQHPITHEVAFSIMRLPLERGPWQTFRFDSDGCIACVAQPNLVLTGSPSSLQPLYLHPKSPSLISRGLQLWAAVESQQRLPPVHRELAHDVCQLRLEEGHKAERERLYVDFNVHPAQEQPIMYAFRDKSNQLLHLEPQRLRILHLSDTHSLHRDIAPALLPTADLLLHTGDFSISGTDAEYRDFDAWLRLLKEHSKFKHCCVITGNHEFHDPSNRVVAGLLPAAQLLDHSYVRARLPNATYLAHEEVVYEGMRIFGSTWEPYCSGCDPDHPGLTPTENALWCAHCCSNPAAATPHKFDAIPAGTHVLLTHGPARGVLDWETGEQAYGSSLALRQRIVACGVRAHLFGHVHEQRGVYAKNAAGGYDGGVQYKDPRMAATPEPGPPPPDYPCDIVSNNAMKNNSRHEDPTRHYIAGPPRLIIAERVPGPGSMCDWRFRLPKPGEQ